jgi:AAA domain
MLSNVDIIGGTTAGAANMFKVLTVSAISQPWMKLTFSQGIRPSVLLVEEAGQVLEAHILGSLVRSIEHVIMIGDPKQLRPTVNNYGETLFHSNDRVLTCTSIINGSSSRTTNL